MANDDKDGQHDTADQVADAAEKALTELEKDLDVVEIDDEGNEIRADRKDKDDKDGDDERLGSEAQGREAEAIEQRRARRREERHLRRDNQRRQLNEGRQAMRENQELRARLDAVTQRLELLDRQQQGYGVVQLESKIQETQNLIRQMGEVEKAATAAGKHEDAVEARNLAAEARENLRDLRATYRQVGEQIETQRGAAGAARGGQVTAPPPVNPQIVENFNRFHASNKWYNPDVRVPDQDSMVTRAIEAALAAEGSDPRTPEHWEELEDRLVEALPHRYNVRGENGDGRGSTRRTDNSSDGNGDDSGNRQRVRGRPPMGGGRDQGTGGNRRTVRISPARKAAMVEAGSWEDPIKRAAMIREYARWDAENGVGTSRQ